MAAPVTFDLAIARVRSLSPEEYGENLTVFMDEHPALFGFLLNLSEEFHKVQNLSSKGIEIGEVKLNLPKMMKNKDKAVTILTKGVEFLLKKNKVTYFKGTGSFKAKNKIVIKATSLGSSPPNTSRIELIDKNQKYPILTQLDLNKSITIYIEK